MTDSDHPGFRSGPSGRSNSMLKSIIDELVQKEVLLGKHIKSIAPTKPVMTIEYESLIFEDPPESAIMKSLRTGSKSLESTVIDGPNCNKVGYKNIGLWSPRSINLEQLMKPVLNISVAMWPDYETVNEILSQADVSEGHMKIAMVDTLLVRLNEAHEVRYGFDRLYSHWSYASNQFEVRKEWVDKIELDILVLSLINDHTASLQLKKEQARLGGMQRQTQSHTSASASATLSAASKIHKIVSAIGVNPNATSGGVKRKVLSEGECRTHAVLKAVCRDGSVHIRPLCTSGDVLLALHELLDPAIFIHGCIQLPHVLSDVFARHTEGFYRYVYTINEPGQWQYLRIALPTHLHWLDQFVQPSYVDTHSVFHIENIPTDRVPVGLREVSIHITKLVVRHYGKAQLLQKMVVDFEACMDITHREVKARKKKKTNTTPATTATTATHSSTTAGTGKSHTTTNNDLYGENIPAPHLQSGEGASRNYHFRLLHISETQFLQCWAGQRRDAVCYMHPATKIQLRNFESYFIEAWELRKREHNKQKAEKFMSQQSGSIKALGMGGTVQTSGNNMNLPGVLNLNTKTMASGSMSPLYNSASRTGGIVVNTNGVSGAGGGGGGGGSGRSTLRVSSHTPFSPFSPIRSVRIDTIGSFSPTATGGGISDRGTNSVGSMLRPGSTIGSKGINTTGNNTIRQSMFDSSTTNTTSSKLTVNTAASAKIDNTFIREMMTNPRSAKMQPRKPDEVDPAKLDAIHLVNILFPRKYKPIVVKKRRGSGSSDSSGESGEVSGEEEGSDTSSGSGSDSSVVSNSNSGSSVESDSEEEEEKELPHNTIFSFVPRLPTNAASSTITSPSAIISAHNRRNTKSDKVRFAPTSDMYTKPAAPLTRTTNTTSIPTSFVRGTGTIIKQALQLNGTAPKRQSIDTTSAKINTTTPDAAILAKYHVTEKQRAEREKRRAEEQRIQQEIVNKFVEEKQQAELRRQAGNNSLYFVTRTNIKAVDVAVPSVVNSADSASSVIGLSGSVSPLRTHSSGGAATITTSTIAKTNTINTTTANTTNTATSGGTSPARTNSPSTTLRKSVSDYRTARAIALADAQRERRKLRRGATQSLDIRTMDSDAAQRIFDEEDRRYRDTLDGVAGEYLDTCEPDLVDTNATIIHNTTYDVDTVVDKELYFSVDSVMRSARENSPDKPNYKAPQRERSLSPLKMFAEMNQSALEELALSESHTATSINRASGGVRMYTTHDIHPIPVHIPHTVQSTKPKPTQTTNVDTTTALHSASPTTLAAITALPSDTTPTTQLSAAIPAHSTTTHTTYPTPTSKTRNDTEFNDRAYALASKLDLAYLVTEFNPANHSRDKTIILDEPKLHNKNSSPSSNGAAHPTDTTNTETATAVELTPAERRAQAKEYAAFMKQLYEEEMSLMMDKMVEKLPDKLASKVRKALLAQQLKQKLKRRKEFINRRRKVEILLPTEVTALAQYYESHAFQEGSQMTDSSSEDEATKRKNDKDMNTLLGEYNVDEATMAAMLAARAAEEQAELDAAEAKRMRRESYLSSKAAEAQAREDKRCADLAAAAAAAEDAVYTDIPDAPLATPESASHKSAAQMRKTIRTYSLMQVTKVLLDGTLVPELSSKNKAEDESDSDGEERKSRPGTSKRYDENGNVITTSLEDAAETGLVRPRSRPQSQPVSRPSLWGMPPMSWRGNSVLLNTASEEVIHEENSVESSSFGHSALDRVEPNDGADAHAEMDDNGSDGDTEAEGGSVSDLQSMRAVVQRVVRTQRSHRDLVIGALGHELGHELGHKLGHELEPPKPSLSALVDVIKSRGVFGHKVNVTSDVQDNGGEGKGEDNAHLHALAALAVQNIIGSAAESVLHLPAPTPPAPASAVSVAAFATPTAPAPPHNRSRAPSGDYPLLSESNSAKEQSPRRKLSFSVKVPTAVVPRILEPVAVSGEKGDAVPSSNATVSEDVAIVAPSAPASTKIVPVSSEKANVHFEVSHGAPLTPCTAETIILPLVRAASAKDSVKRSALPIQEQVSFRAPLFEEPSVTSTLTGPESDFMNDFSRENSAEFDLHDVQDLLRTVRRPDTVVMDAFVHKRSPRVTVSNSIMKANTDGRPPTGLVFNMVKPVAPSKPSPMDKVNSLKGLPLLKKPQKKTSEAHPAPHTKPSSKRHADVGPASEDRDSLKLSEEPAKPKGLYLIPGAAVASFAQKPPAEKPTRPIVYTTRVMMQQKIRECTHDATPENLTVSTLTFSEAPTPEESTNVQGRISQVAGHNAPVVDMTGVRSGYADDLAYVEMSDELLQLSGELVDDSCHNITTTQLSMYDRTEFHDPDLDPPRTTKHATSNQIEEEGQLRLDAVEWRLILNAAREQAHDLDLDIVSHEEEFVPPDSALDVRDIHIDAGLPANATNALDLSAVCTVEESTIPASGADHTPWRLARLGEENFNWRGARGERSLVLETELDDSDVDTSPGNSPKVKLGYGFGALSHVAASTRAPQTLEELLAHLGVVPPYRSTSPAVSPPVSPGRAVRKNVFTVSKHMHSLSEPAHTDTVSYVATVIEDPALQITKLQYSKKPYLPLQKPPFVRPMSAHKVKPSAAESTVKQVAVQLPVAAAEQEPQVKEITNNVAVVDDIAINVAVVEDIVNDPLIVVAHSCDH